jgi:hypothetical protein
MQDFRVEGYLLLRKISRGYGDKSASELLGQSPWWVYGLSPKPPNEMSHFAFKFAL